MAYLPKLNPTVGGGLGGLPERRATGGVSNSIQRSIIGQAVKGSLAYRNTTTGDTYSLDPIDDLTEQSTVTLTGKTSQTAVATAMFNDGKFVIAYSNNSGVCIEIYNFDGTINVSQVVVDAAFIAGKRIAVAINPVNENITLIYAGGLAGTTIRRAIYSKTGSVVSGATQIKTGVAAQDQDGVLSIDHFSDGWYAIHSLVSTAGTNSNIWLYNDSNTNVANTTTYFNAYVGRLKIRCLTASPRRFAISVTSSGGISGNTYAPKIQQWTVENGNNLVNTNNYLIGDLGTSSADRVEICYNSYDNEIVSFFCDTNNYWKMTSHQLLANTGSTYTPSKQRGLEYCVPTNMSAVNIGRDRYLVTFGGSGASSPIYAGVLNSFGDWVSPPTICSFVEYSFGSIQCASTKSGGKAVVCMPEGTNIRFKTFSYRDFATETYSLKEIYPVKVADFYPQIVDGEANTFNVNATATTNKFVVCWQENTGKNITWSIYSSGGTLLNGPYVNTELIVTDVCFSQKALFLPNGNIVLIVQANNNIKFGIYNSSGVLQGSITTVSTANWLCDAEVAANGNILIISRSTANSYPQYAIYDQTGTVVSANQNLNSVTIDYTMVKVIYNSTIDRWLVLYRNSANQYFHIGVVTTTGTITQASTIGSTTLDKASACVLPDGSYFIIAFNSSHVMHYAKVSSGGSVTTAITVLSRNLPMSFNNSFQLLSLSNSEVMMISFGSENQHISSIILNTSNGTPSTTKKNFGVGSSWYEKYFTNEGVQYIKYKNQTNARDVIVTKSSDGNQFIATACGDVFILSPSVTAGDYVIDGAINSEANNGTVQVITNGIVTRSNNLPRITSFISDATDKKKIVAAKKSIAVSS